MTATTTFGEDTSPKTMLAVGGFARWRPTHCVFCCRIIWPWQLRTISDISAAIHGAPLLQVELFPSGLHYKQCLGPWIEAEKKKREPPHKETYDYKVHAITIRHWISPDVYFDEVRKDPDRQPQGI